MQVRILTKFNFEEKAIKLLKTLNVLSEASMLNYNR